MTTVRYAGGLLDRATKLREDDDWIAAAFVSDAAAAVLIHNDQNLVTRAARREDARIATVPLSLLRERVSANGTTWVFLGLDGEVPVFTVDATTDVIANIPEIQDAGEFVDLRWVGPVVPADQAALMAYARAMVLWHRRHRYCGACGATTVVRRGGHVRRCTSADCAAESFPRTDPVVIMLVTRPASADQPSRCLLGRHSRLPPGAYSLLAGFVEPGESLEDAVAREVWEETGVRVRDVRYEASQPWPFPYSMMIGFHAVGETDDIVVDADELEDARWFTAAQVAEFGEWEDEMASFRRPRKDSIARFLLDQWVATETTDW